MSGAGVDGGGGGGIGVALRRCSSYILDVDCRWMSDNMI